MRDESVVDAFLDLVLGGSCVVCTRPGRSLCPTCGAELPRDAGPRRPDPAPAGLAEAFAVGDYAGPLKALVIAHKEHRTLSLRRPLGRLLAQSVRAATGAGWGTWPVLLVPVGSARGSARRRGHDPLLGIVRAASADLRGSGLTATPARLLVQRGTVRDQAGLDAQERATNLAGTQFCPSSGVRRVAGRRAHVVLCDDVLTTGSTAREAQRALEAAGLPVLAVAVVAATVRRRKPSVHGELSDSRLSPGPDTH